MKTKNNRTNLARLAVMLVFAVMTSATAWAWSGSGEPSNPWLIQSVSDGNIGANKAYLTYTPPSPSTPAPEFFGFDESTGITTTDYTDYTDEADAWFTLDGRRLQGKPSTKGLYIKDGKKTVIK